MTDTPDQIARTLAQTTGTWRPLLRVALVVAGIAFAVLGWMVFQGIGTGRGDSYVTTPVVRADFKVTVTATGTVEPTNLVDVSSELSGTIESVYVDFNDTVEVGTVLAALDTRKLKAQLAIAQAASDAASARVVVAQAALDKARGDYDIARTLENRGVTSHQAFSAQNAMLRQAEAELQSAEADQALALATLDLHRADLENACICSPIQGVVLQRAIDPGQIVAASLTAPVLFSIAEDLREMELQVDIDEADIGRVAVGNAATFTVDAYEDKTFPATISQIRFAAEVVSSVVTYKAVLDVANSDMLLRPGMTATAEIIVAEVANALVVPNGALRYAPRQTANAPRDDGGSGLLGMLIPRTPETPAASSGRAVWMLRDNQPVQVAVRPGDTDGEITEILEGVLIEGDLVITGDTNG
ncbi:MULTISPECIES: efflux RND transporter periplasmic adaptor subunit [Roseobacteraceae]|uniref:RND family efflux transporter MFP subunit n=1 Tax=Celeribacter baekdonensis B30 TaxID=1208323 RepID=K2JWF1_9RHOB|nr:MULTISPECIES: efflux RND transporter periplasmic adaptor subunit [Roseobacteraceae]EKE74619.1 RND family efflux transporter MFP subunit [Celeribacter baekdonensis B30]KAB6714801.1 efflux RND transporter periplasmic adaptor subunit [Roseobacter sp. TSBP12]